MLRPGDPNVPIDITGDDLRQIEQAFSPFLKNPKDHRLVRGAGAYYADPADKRFIVEQHGKAIVVTGCGGRMFKFGALVGSRVAQCLNGSFPTERLAKPGERPDLQHVDPAVFDEHVVADVNSDDTADDHMMGGVPPVGRKGHRAFRGRRRSSQTRNKAKTAMTVASAARP